MLQINLLTSGQCVPNGRIALYRDKLLVLTAGATICLHYADCARRLAVINGFLSTLFLSFSSVCTASFFFCSLSFLLTQSYRLYDHQTRVPVFWQLYDYYQGSFDQRVDRWSNILGLLTFSEVYVTNPQNVCRVMLSDVLVISQMHWCS